MVRRSSGVNDILRDTSAPLRAEDGRGYTEREATDDTSVETTGPPEGIGCGVRQLPKRLLVKAAEVAARLNPPNAPVFGFTAAVSGGVLRSPLAAAVATAKYWGPKPRKLTVSFMDSTSTTLRKKIVAHLNAWTLTGGIEFVETQGIGHVRISRGSGGYWSYLGSDILLIPKNKPTMNLQGFTLATRESEYRRVVRHEAGHTLGLEHEHMRKELVARIDPKKAYKYFLETQGWDEETVNQQVLTPLDDASIMATPPDEDSIMCYQLPGSITTDGKPILGGDDINETDYAFIGQIYPKTVPTVTGGKLFLLDEWPESEDIAASAAELAAAV